MPGFETASPTLTREGIAGDPDRTLAEYLVRIDKDECVETLQRLTATAEAEQEAAYNFTQAQRADYDTAGAAITRYIDHQGSIGRPVDPDELAHLEQRRQNQRDRLKASHQVAKRKTQKSSESRVVHAKVMKYVAALCAQKADVEHVFTEIPANVTIEALREGRKALRDEVEALNRATGGIEEDRRVLRAQVDALLAEAMPKVSRQGTKVRLSWPIQSVNAAPLSGRDALMPHILDGRGLALFAARDAVMAHIDEQLTQFYAGKPKPLTKAAKVKRLAEIADQLLESDRIEAEVLWAGLEAGEDVWFPTDLDVRAILGIA